MLSGFTNPSPPTCVHVRVVPYWKKFPEQIVNSSIGRTVTKPVPWCSPLIPYTYSLQNLFRPTASHPYVTFVIPLVVYFSILFSRPISVVWNKCGKWKQWVAQTPSCAIAVEFQRVNASHIFSMCCALALIYVALTQWNSTLKSNADHLKSILKASVPTLFSYNVYVCVIQVACAHSECIIGFFNHATMMTRV